MERVIKFRAWDGGKMINHEYEKYVMMFDGTIGQFNGKTYDEMSHWVLMQFTGLFDRNRKEIYESDIVKYHDHPTGVNDGAGAVYWKDGMWKVEWSMIPLGDYGTAWVEVIGNIYETPISSPTKQ